MLVRLRTIMPHECFTPGCHVRMCFFLVDAANNELPVNIFYQIE